MIGLDVFREAFAACQGDYALIGGAACYLHFTEIGEVFRVTKDLDIVLLSHEPDRRFAKTIAAFVNAGGYEPWARSTGQEHYYRFEKPSQPDYPVMLELFPIRAYSRKAVLIIEK